MPENGEGEKYTITVTYDKNYEIFWAKLYDEDGCVSTEAKGETPSRALAELAANIALLDE